MIKEYFRSGGIFNRALKSRVVIYTIILAFFGILFFLSQKEITRIKAETAEIYKKIENDEARKEQAFLKVYFLNVGRGDATFINYFDEYQILIDGGLSENILSRYLDKLMPAEDKKIEMMILTHNHKDHYGGFFEVLSNFQVERFVKNYSKISSDFKEKLLSKNINIEEFWSGDFIMIDDLFRLYFLSPNKDKINDYPPFYSEDNSSLVGRVKFGNNSFLFMGDAGHIAEKEIMKEGRNIKADFLKVGHHGYNDASSEEFLFQVSPKHAIITKGSTLPDNGTIEKLKKINALVYQLGSGSKGGNSVAVKCFYNKEECEIISQENIDNLLNL